MTQDVKLYTIKILEDEMNFTMANKLHLEYQLSLPTEHRLVEFKDIDETEWQQTIKDFSQHIYNIKKCIKQLEEIPALSISHKN